MGGSPQYKVLLLGLDGAGKTTLYKQIMKEDTAVTMPTLGFAQRLTTLGNLQCQIFDVGGAALVRSSWVGFLQGVSGIIYVIDSADHRRMEEAGLELDVVLTALTKRKQTPPVLVIANKSDLRLAATESEVVQHLSLTGTKSEYSVKTCSALRGEGVADALAWLVQKIGGKK